MLATEACASRGVWRNVKWNPCKYMMLFKIVQYWGGTFFVFYTFTGTNIHSNTLLLQIKC